MMATVLTLLAHIGLLCRLPSLRMRQWIARASKQHALGASKASPELRQLLIDVSVIHWHDSGTGIQRVVRSVLDSLESNPPVAFKIRYVIAQRRQCYQYVDTLGQSKTMKVTMRPGDIFFGLDLAAHLLPHNIKQLLKWKLAGGILNFVIYDMLPLSHPELFTRPRVRHFRLWAKFLALMADGWLCISHSVKVDVQKWVEKNTDLLSEQLRIVVIPMGNDLPAKRLKQQASKEVTEVLRKLNNVPWALMVGTLEPRKCHAQVLNAFERLWQQGNEFALVFVGHKGWQTKALQQRINQHLQINKNLFWFHAAADADLEHLYQNTTGVLTASIAESYGLPIIEALRYRKPLLVRDIPVFREVAGNNAVYFTNDTPAEFSHTLGTWLRNSKFDKIECNNISIMRNWAEATESIIKILEI